MDSERSHEPMNLVNMETVPLNNTNVLPTLHCSTFKPKNMRSVRSLQEQIKENILTNRFNRRKENLEQITHANMFLFKRINSQRSAYSLKSLETTKECTQQSTQQSRATTVSNFRTKSSSTRFLRGTPDIFRDRQFQTNSRLPLNQLRVYSNTVFQEDEKEVKQIVVDGPRQQLVSNILRVKARTKGKQNESGIRVGTSNLLEKIEEQLSKNVQRGKGNLIHIF